MNHGSKCMRCTAAACNPTQAAAQRDGTIAKYNEEDNGLTSLLDEGEREERGPFIRLN